MRAVKDNGKFYIKKEVINAGTNSETVKYKAIKSWNKGQIFNE